MKNVNFHINTGYGRLYFYGFIECTVIIEMSVIIQRQYKVSNIQGWIGPGDI